jgi:hypothetical protein
MSNNLSQINQSYQEVIGKLSGEQVLKSRKSMNIQSNSNKATKMSKRLLIPGLCKFLILILTITTTACQETTTNPSEQLASPSPIPEANSTSPSPTPASDLIDDLENNKGVNKQGGMWFTYDDKPAGGDSKVATFKPVIGGANNSQFSALLKGEVGATLKTGYIGMGMNLQKDGKPIDISQFKGVEFCAKGEEGRKYSFRLRSQAIPNYNDYSFTFVTTPEWKCYQISFTDMKQSGSEQLVPLPQALAQATTILWHVGQPHSSVELNIDDVGLWK